MAKKKSSGSGHNNRDSESKRLGIKCFDGEQVHCGTIIVRQRGSHLNAGVNVDMGKDYTIFSVIDGFVKFEDVSRNKKRVSVYPERQQTL